MILPIRGFKGNRILYGDSLDAVGEATEEDTDNEDGDFNDKICRYIVYIIYRSSCLSRTTRLVGAIAIFQQYVLVI